MIVIDRNSKILFWVFAFLLAGSILFSAHRFLIAKNFFIDLSNIESSSEETESGEEAAALVETEE